LWRPPTDNDRYAEGGRKGKGVGRLWLAWGLDQLRLVTDETTSLDGAVQRRRVFEGSEGLTATQTTTIAPLIDGVQVREHLEIPDAWNDLPRVGVRMQVDSAFDALRWSGLGPDESYPDRLSSQRHGVWDSAVADQYHDFVVPQEHGHHLACRWFELADAAGRTLRFESDEPFGFSALDHTADDLTSATVLSELARADHIEIHLDTAMRGLGTAACGPDTTDEHIVRGGVHEFTWRLRTA
jgi:beta-galactosidase